MDKVFERFFFHPSERLRLQKEMDTLFKAGQSFISYPLRVIYLPKEVNPASDSAITMLVSVSKKRIKHAVERNRIKRLIRESFRLNKNETATLFRQNDKQLDIAYIYIGNSTKTFAVVEKAVLKAFETIRRKENISL